MAEIELPEGMTEEDAKKMLAKIASKNNTQGEPKIFKKIEKINGELRVYRDFYKNREILSVRNFYKNEFGDLLPGKGVTFIYDDIEEIVEGLQAMKESLDEEAPTPSEVTEDGEV